MLVERQGTGIIESVAIPKLGAQPRDPVMVAGERVVGIRSLRDLVIRLVTAGHRGFNRQAVAGTGGRHPAPVVGIAHDGPTQKEGTLGVALFLYEVLNFLGRETPRFYPVVFIAWSEVQASILTDRVAKVHPGTDGIQNKGGYFLLLIVRFPCLEAETTADSINRVEGIGVGYVGAGHRVALIEPQGCTPAAAQEILLGHAGTEDQTGGLGEANVGRKTARRLLLDRIGNIHFVIRTGHGRGVRVNPAEEAGALKLVPGGFNPAGRGNTALHLGHFLTQHFTVGRGIAPETDPPNVGAFAWLHINNHGNGAVVMGSWRGFHIGKAVSLSAEPAGNQVGCHGHALLGEQLTFLQSNQFAQFFLRHNQVTLKLHLPDLELLPLIDSQGYKDLLLILSQRNIGGLNTERHIPIVQVVGANAFEVTGEFFPCVLIRVGNGVPPPRLTQLHQADQFRVGKRFVADDIDVLDGGDIAFVNIEVDGDPVARQRLNVRVHIRVITPLGDIGAENFQLQTFKGGALEDLALFNTRLAHALHELFGLDILVALNLDTRDRWALFHGYNQHVAFTGERDVRKETRLEKIADSIGDRGIIQPVPNLNRQGAEDIPRGYPLKTFHLNIRNPEGFGLGQHTGQCQHQCWQQLP